MAENYSNLETKQNSLEQLARLAGVPPVFTYTAEEWNQIRAKLNDLKFLIDNLSVDGGAGLQGLQKTSYSFYMSTFPENVATYLNNRTIFTIPAGTIPEFVLYLLTYDGNEFMILPTVRKYSLKNAQQGIFGNGGSRILTEEELQLTYEATATADDLEDAPGTQLITFPNISTSIADWLNAEDLVQTLQPEDDGLVILRGTILSEPTSFLFVGTRGDYGDGETPATVADFEPLEEADNSDMMPIDDFFSLASFNPVQNKTITSWKNELENLIANLPSGGLTTQQLDFILQSYLKNIKQKLITLSLGDIGADNFEDNIPQKIVDYMTTNGIVREINTLHKWLVAESVISLRLPTSGEWQSEIDTWSSNNLNGSFNSPLKLILGGGRNPYGDIFQENGIGMYWTSTIIGYKAIKLLTSSQSSSWVTVESNARAEGNSIRLIISGIFTQQQFEDNYENKIIQINGLNYGFVYNPTTKRIWLDRNLGASQAATSSTDELAHGDLFQWGRRADGHEKRTSLTYDGDTLAKPSTVNESGAWDGKFITVEVTPLDWLNSQDNTLWQSNYVDPIISKKQQIYILNNTLETDYTNIDADEIVLLVDNSKEIIHPSDWEGLAYESDLEDLQAESEEQEVITGGIYDNFQVEGNIIVCTNTDGKAVFTGFNVSSKYKIIHLINNSNFEVQVDNSSSSSLEENQISLPNNVANVGLRGTTVFAYITKGGLNKWQIIDVFGSRYMPEHKGLTEDAIVVVGENSVSGSKEIINLYETNESITNASLTNSELNALYENQIVGFELICENAGDNGIVYKLINDSTGTWKKMILT